MLAVVSLKPTSFVHLFQGLILGLYQKQKEQLSKVDMAILVSTMNSQNLFMSMVDTKHCLAINMDWSMTFTDMKLILGRGKWD